MAGNQQLRNILKTINFGNLTGANINEIGKNVFADLGAKADITNLQEITNAWRAVTTPAYGQFIPQTSAQFNGPISNIGETAILTPTGNEVFVIWGINIKNASGGALAYTIAIEDSDGNSFNINGDDVPIADGSMPQILDSPLYLDSNQHLVGNATGLLTCQVYYFKVAG
jgi:hypothetical protein